MIYHKCQVSQNFPYFCYFFGCVFIKNIGTTRNAYYYFHVTTYQIDWERNETFFSNAFHVHLWYTNARMVIKLNWKLQNKDIWNDFVIGKAGSAIFLPVICMYKWNEEKWSQPKRLSRKYVSVVFIGSISLTWMMYAERASIVSLLQFLTRLEKSSSIFARMKWKEVDIPCFVIVFVAVYRAKERRKGDAMRQLCKMFIPFVDEVHWNSSQSRSGEEFESENKKERKNGAEKDGDTHNQ